MKTRKFSFVVILTLFLSGCVVYSFYPLYTEKDLFANDLLTGEWIYEDDGTEWQFKHPQIGNKAERKVDSTRYILRIKSNEEVVMETIKKEAKESVFEVHVIKLGGHYFLDFYLKDFGDQMGDDLGSFHIIPVHTFAKLTIKENMLVINWFDGEWLSDLIDENKIRIHHEKNDDLILLTAKPNELQKFVTKYVNSEEAFKDGLEVILTRK